MAHSLRFVVAANDPTLRSYIRRCLERRWGEGLRLSDTTNGAEVLEALDRMPTDLLICDEAMPELDGVQLIEAVRARAAQAGTPVLLLTGETLAPSRKERLEELGNVLLLPKPFNARRLTRAVEQALGGGGTN